MMQSDGWREAIAGHLKSKTGTPIFVAKEVDGGTEYRYGLLVGADGSGLALLSMDLDFTLPTGTLLTIGLDVILSQSIKAQVTFMPWDNILEVSILQRDNIITLFSFLKEAA